MSGLRHLAHELAALERDHLLRPQQLDLPEGALVLCSNDYLGYARKPLSPSSTEPGGAGASRLVSGDAAPLRALEADLARWLGCEAALLFSSGYAANVGLLSALASREDVIVSDALNHASIIDGCRLSRAEVIVVPHLDTAAVASALQQTRDRRRRYVVTESYFSMDGDCADVSALRRICDEHDAALLVDEAHALGVFGQKGAGLCRQHGVQPDALVGTLGKSIGAQGAFVAGSSSLRHWLFNRARSFVFSTGVSPAMAAAIRQRLPQVIADEAGRSRLMHICENMRVSLAEMGAPIAPSSTGPIIPWHIGPSSAALQAGRQLLERGLFIQPIRPPTVPAGSARLRITLRADLSDDESDRALKALRWLAGAPNS